MADFKEKCALWLHWESQLHTGGRLNPAGRMGGDVISSGRLTDGDDDDGGGDGGGDVSKLVVKRSLYRPRFPPRATASSVWRSIKSRWTGERLPWQPWVFLRYVSRWCWLQSRALNESLKPTFLPSWRHGAVTCPVWRRRWFYLHRNQDMLKVQLLWFTLIGFDHIATCSWQGLPVGLINQLKRHVHVSFGVIMECKNCRYH